MHAAASDDNPLARTQIKAGIDGLEAYGVRLKCLHRLAGAYSAALLVRRPPPSHHPFEPPNGGVGQLRRVHGVVCQTAAGCWGDLVTEMREIAPTLQLRDEGEQVPT